MFSLAPGKTALVDRLRCIHDFERHSYRRSFATWTSDLRALNMTDVMKPVVLVARSATKNSSKTSMTSASVQGIRANADVALEPCIARFDGSATERS